jgi:zinc transport system permease protein
MLSLFQSDPFLLRALLAGLGLSFLTAPAGCFVVWQRMSYFGDSLAHSALLGVALALFLSVSVPLSVLAVCSVFAAALFALERQRLLSLDTLLGVLAHSALAAGLACMALLKNARVDLHSLLFGDILSISAAQTLWIYALAGTGGLLMALFWKPLLLTAVDESLARAEQVNTLRARLALFLVLALTVAGALHLAGALLTTALLIIPAAAARQLAGSPRQMAVLAWVLSVAAVLSGLMMSYFADMPAGPMIVLCAAALFLLCLSARAMGAGRA